MKKIQFYDVQTCSKPIGLRNWIRSSKVSPLYGTMETHEQDSVLQAREGWRKVPGTAEFLLGSSLDRATQIVSQRMGSLLGLSSEFLTVTRAPLRFVRGNSGDADCGVFIDSVSELSLCGCLQVTTSVPVPEIHRLHRHLNTAILLEVGLNMLKS